MRTVEEPLLEEVEGTSQALHFLIAPEPRWRIFAQNLVELLHTRDDSPLRLQSAPAPFWSDVFVERKLPWRRFLESGGYHLLALILIWEGSRFLTLQPHVTVQPAFNHSDVVYYAPSEYLPPLDTRRPTSAHAQKADPELSAQPIISVPPEADNHSQTVVTPPKIQLKHDVPLPNTVAWSEKPALPIAPAPVVLASQISRLAPQMERSVIAPPPEADNTSQKNLQAPEPSVIAPPPALDAASNRDLGDLNVGHSTVIAPAPQLSLEEQRSVPGGRSSAVREPSQVIAPPPSVSASGGSPSGRSIIALSLHPAVGAPPEAIAGNRRGSFAATPEGHRGASGTPAAAGASTADGSGAAKNSTGSLPSGLYVGKTANPTSPVAGDPRPVTSSPSVNPNLIAGMRRLRISRTQSDSDPSLSEPERAVFGDRKVYSLSLNMPNLNSSGGSWVIHFAALNSDSTLANSTGEAVPSAQLSSPVATLKVDPAYPLEVMKQNVSGTVILHAVILADGTVGQVRVIRSIDDRLDKFASEAIAKWQFQPATKNGAPVAVEATFWIPFRPTRAGSNF